MNPALSHPAFDEGREGWHRETHNPYPADDENHWHWLAGWRHAMATYRPPFMEKAP